MVQVLPQDDPGLLAHFLGGVGQGLNRGFETAREENREGASINRLAQALGIKDQATLDQMRGLKPEHAKLMMQNVVQKNQNMANNAAAERALGLPEGSLAGADAATQKAIITQHGKMGSQKYTRFKDERNQIVNQAKEKIKNKYRSNSVQDVLGQMRLALEGDAKKDFERGIEQIKKAELQSLKKLYKKYGEEIPEDIEALLVDDELSALMNPVAMGGQGSVQTQILDASNPEHKAIVKKVYEQTGGDPAQMSIMLEQLGYRLAQ